METHTSRLKIAAFILTSLFYLYGCNSEKQQLREIRKANTQLLNNLNNKPEAITESDFLDIYLSSVLPGEREKLSLVCCVDNSCSVCIADFCVLAKAMKDTDNLEIFALVDSGTLKTFQYYAEQVLGQDANCFQTVPIDDLDYFFVLLILPKGTQSFLLSGNSVIGKLGLADGHLYYSE